ncbi:hypothetical protein H5410_028137, partial [Solanum commersonii]
VFEVLLEAWTLRRKTKQKGLKRTRNESMRIAESNLASLQIDMHRPLFHTVPPNDPEYEDAKGKTMKLKTPILRFSKICAAADNSATLVGIVDQLRDSPFGVVHRRLTPSFGIVVLWVIRRHSTSSWNISAMHRLHPFSTDLILSFRAQHIGTKGEVRPFGDSLGGIGDPQAFIFFVLFSLFIPFCEVVSAVQKGISNGATQ